MAFIWLIFPLSQNHSGKLHHSTATSYHYAAQKYKKKKNYLSFCFVSSCSSSCSFVLCLVWWIVPHQSEKVDSLLTLTRTPFSLSQASHTANLTLQYIFDLNSLISFFLSPSSCCGLSVTYFYFFSSFPLVIYTVRKCLFHPPVSALPSTC